MKLRKYLSRCFSESSHFKEICNFIFWHLDFSIFRLRSDARVESKSSTAAGPGLPLSPVGWEILICELIILLLMLSTDCVMCSICSEFLVCHTVLDDSRVDTLCCSSEIAEYSFFCWVIIVSSSSDIELLSCSLIGEGMECIFFVLVRSILVARVEIVLNRVGIEIFGQKWVLFRRKWVLTLY